MGTFVLLATILGAPLVEVAGIPAALAALAGAVLSQMIEIAAPGAAKRSRTGHSTGVVTMAFHPRPNNQRKIGNLVHKPGDF